MNGEINGFHNSLIDEDCFLFTSESVGEGHPGEKATLATNTDSVLWLVSYLFRWLV